jgi:uncharacterized protein (DUF58 family)
VSLSTVENSQKFLDPRTLAKVKDLEVRARRIVEGFVSGSHKSPFQGVSVEFAEHRQYTAGDDTRHIDWKLYGKTDKYYLKRYEQETNLVCNLVIDTSESMKYGSGSKTKLDYTRELAAVLAYLILHQQDSVGAAFFEHKLRYLVPPSGQASHLNQILHLLAVCQPANVASKIGPVLDELAGRWSKRSLVFIMSDCFDDVEGLLSGLKHLKHRRHELVLVHVLDPAELDFPFKDVTLFKGLESLPEALVEPRAIRKAYREEFEKFRRGVEIGCRTADVDYQLVRTDEPIDRFLTRFLSTRASRRSLA